MHYPFESDLTADEYGAPVEEFNVLKEREVNKKRLNRQTKKLAQILEDNGIEAKRQRGEVYRVGAYVLNDENLVIDEIDDYRNICFLPTVAKRNRADFLKSLRFFLRRKTFARYLVLTNGQRCEVKDLRENAVKFKRKISKFHHLVRKKYNIVFACSVLEFPINEQKTCHLHANIIYYPLKTLSTQQWQAFLADLRSYFGTWGRDNGRLKNVDEVVKYPFKPNDIKSLNSDEILELYRQTLKFRVAEAFGEFKEFRQSLEEKKLKLFAKDGKLFLIRKRVMPERLPSILEYLQAKGLPITDADIEDSKKKKREKAAEFSIIAMTRPQSDARYKFKQPFLIVKTNNKDKIKRDLEQYYQDQLAEQLEQWQEHNPDTWAKHGAFIFNTTTISVQEYFNNNYQLEHPPRPKRKIRRFLEKSDDDPNSTAEMLNLVSFR